jgi:hypothetical protein
VLLRDALRLARDLGLEVRERKGTGELLVSDGGKPMAVKASAKDAPKALVLYLRKRQGRKGTSWRSSS